MIKSNHEQRISSLALCLTAFFHIRLPAGNGRGVRGEQLDQAGNDVRWRARQAPSFLIFSQLSYIFKRIFYEIFDLFNAIKFHHFGTSYKCADDLKYFLAMLLKIHVQT
jgi:hypothetical protein